MSGSRNQVFQHKFGSASFRGDLNVDDDGHYLDAASNSMASLLHDGNIADPGTWLTVPITVMDQWEPVTGLRLSTPSPLANFQGRWIRPDVATSSLLTLRRAVWFVDAYMTALASAGTPAFEYGISVNFNDPNPVEIGAGMANSNTPQVVTMHNFCPLPANFTMSLKVRNRSGTQDLDLVIVKISAFGLTYEDFPSI